jgi:hypothetical protein
MSPLEMSHLLNYARAFLSVNRTAILKVGLGVSAAALVFGAGYTTATLQRAHDAEKRQNAQVEQVVKTVVQNKEIERKVYVQDLEKTRALEAEKARLTAQVADLQKKVNLYVPEIPASGYLSRGAVRLLNDAASGNSSTATTPAAELAGEDTGASSVGWRDFVSSELDVRLRYNLARQQCNALIDWVEAYVVNPPKASIKNYE